MPNETKTSPHPKARPPLRLLRHPNQRRPRLQDPPRPPQTRPPLHDNSGVSEPLVTAREVAELLGFSTGWVLDQWEAGKLPGFRIGTRKGSPVRF